MKIRLIAIGLVVGVLLPLASANAGAVFDPGLNPAGAGADLERGVTPTAENFWRDDHRCDGDHDKDDRHCQQRCNDGDKDDKGKGGHKNHQDCDKSKSKH
jgi:hypothetical protein